VTSRTRYRAVGIAALIAATAATVEVVLVSQGSDGTRVTPLREETTKQEQRRKPADDAGNLRLVTPAARSQATAGRIDGVHGRRARKQKRAARQDRGGAGKPRVRQYKRAPRSRSGNSGPPRGRIALPLPLAVPTAAAPTAVNMPAAAAEPAPAEQGGTQPSSTGEKATTNGALPVEIEIEGREFKTELNPAHSHDRHVRLRNRSDQFVVVDVEDEEVSRPLPPDGEMLIGLDIFFTSGFKVELRRNNGVLVLRLHD
jgi:hypothetical protein